MDPRGNRASLCFSTICIKCRKASKVAGVCGFLHLAPSWRKRALTLHVVSAHPEVRNARRLYEITYKVPHGLINLCGTFTALTTVKHHLAHPGNSHTAVSCNLECLRCQYRFQMLVSVRADTQKRPSPTIK